MILYIRLPVKTLYTCPSEFFIILIPLETLEVLVPFIEYAESLESIQTCGILTLDAILVNETPLTIISLSLMVMGK